MYDQITIPKSLALSKLVYNTSILTFPLEFFFVWNSKTENQTHNKDWSKT